MTLRGSEPISFKRRFCRVSLSFLILAALASWPLAIQANGTVQGELKQWHKITLTLDGPQAAETDTKPNPFTDYRLTVTFTHQSGTPSYRVPGYFAADGRASETSASSGNQWRAHLSPDKPGKWRYTVSFLSGDGIAWNEKTEGRPVPGCDGLTGDFEVAPTDKTGSDFRARGRLQYADKHYLKCAGTGEYFLKAGADAPETLLAYADFDGTEARKPEGPLKTWTPHIQDWRTGDPCWKKGKGKGLIGALNYLASKGVNSFSFIPYNAGGDGDNVWPFVQRDDKFHYDCSKLDQWGIVFEHANARGIHAHFKLQETENDDLNGPGAAQSLDGGDLGPERKLYLREMIARFGHLLALNWNLGEENTQTPAQQRAMAAFIRNTDPYRHNIVIHSYPNKQDQVYTPLLGSQSELTGASLQNSWSNAHQRTLKWVVESDRAGKPWVVANDEQNPADTGVPPDPGFEGYNGSIDGGKRVQTIDDIRQCTLWGNLLAGGAGVEYYFGYKLPQNDLLCEDFRSRDKSWDYCRIALEFFRENKVPFWEMRNADELVGNDKHDNSKYCFAKSGSLYLVFLPNGGDARLDLRNSAGSFIVRWFNPRKGGPLQDGSVTQVRAGDSVALGTPPQDPGQDWLAVVSKESFGVTIQVDAGKARGELTPIWRFFGYDEPNFTYMKDGRKLLAELGQIGPEPVYVRTHHLLTSGDGSPALKWGSSGAYSEDAAGHPVYNWTILDRIFDTYLERGLKPYVQIGFMPEALSSHPQDYPHNPPFGKMVFPGTGFSYPPKDYAKWSELCYQWAEHCAQRYGRSEAENWWWEVWNEPNISYWKGTPQEYHKLYDYAAAGVRRALPRARFGGPETAGGPGGSFLRNFLEHCLHGTNYATGKTGSPLDFISFHAKGSPKFQEGHVRMGIANQLRDIDAGFATVAAFPELRRTPIVIGESDPEGCAACQGPQLGYRNGTMYSSYTAASFARKYELADKYGVNFQGALTWAFEFEDQPWFAGFRALASNGVDLPVLNVFRMFGKMSGRRLAVTSTAGAEVEAMRANGVRSEPDVSALASLDGKRLCVLAWHYHDDDLSGPNAEIDLTLSGLPVANGQASVHHFRIDSHHSNSFEAWKRMGSPPSPTLDQYAQLERAGQLEPLVAPQTLTVEAGQARLKFTLPRQAVSLVVVEFSTQ